LCYIFYSNPYVLKNAFFTSDLLVFSFQGQTRTELPGFSLCFEKSKKKVEPSFISSLHQEKRFKHLFIILIAAIIAAIILFGGRRSGLMVSALVPGVSGPGSRPWPGTLCCVLGQDTRRSQCLSLPRSINGYRRIVGET